MTKIVLTENLKKQALQQYHPYINIGLWSLEQEEYDNSENSNGEIILQDTVNIKILNEHIEQLLSNKGQQQYRKYVTMEDDEGKYKGDFTNIVFTPKDNLDVIIPYEYYKGVFYLELPRFYREISLHILSSCFDASDDVVLFHTEDILEYLNDSNTPAEKIITGENSVYNIDENNFTAQGPLVRYLIDLPYEITTLSSLEIDTFYRYLSEGYQTSSFFNGIIDTNNRNYAPNEQDAMFEDQKTLLGAESYYEREFCFAEASRNENINNPLDDDYYEYSEDFANPIITIYDNIDKQHESIVKYINDDVYIEEYNQQDNTDRQQNLQGATEDYNYAFKEWTD